MTEPMTDNDRNGMLFKGMMLGAVIGGVFTLIDSSTRSRLKETAYDIKSTSQRVLNEAKENPGEMKEQMVSQFTEVTNVLKEVITDAQNLYERLNEDVFSRMSEMKEVSSGALGSVKDMKDDLKQIGSKIVDAGSELKGITSVSNAASTGNQDAELNGKTEGSSADKKSAGSNNKQGDGLNNQTSAGSNNKKESDQNGKSDAASGDVENFTQGEDQKNPLNSPGKTKQSYQQQGVNYKENDGNKEHGAKH